MSVARPLFREALPPGSKTDCLTTRIDPQSARKLPCGEKAYVTVAIWQRLHDYAILCVGRYVSGAPARSRSSKWGSTTIELYGVIFIMTIGLNTPETRCRRFS